MIRFILVRHVESEGNVRKNFNGVIESPLTERGMIMKDTLTEALAAMHRKTPFDQILSSPIKRAQCIAKDLSEKTALPLTMYDALKEFNFGIFEGMNSKEAAERYPDEWAQWMADYDGYPIPQGDSGDDYHRRLTAFLKEKENEFEDQTIVIIAHGGTVHSILMHYLGLPLREKWHFNISLGSIITLRVIDGFGILDSLTVPEYQ